ncbi:hypothetical protein [Methanosarcina mazei]|uniref:DUF2178 domain-containing protein n=1 Tax=Methanosarcina mazei TaxID=2209 RepID=A0A0F8S5F4_METMZ|nr:hypothetical protein [Methanosarcina mazei]KKF98094.1 hypothetical protein DU47_08355 [Methanosarcina mazei]KKG04521.1 hypothetical protein DU31_09130 [Methanosarcina mazei]KKG06478.1 hypothetical protein DU40_03340 [Methanosarcina mazei]KKG91843.1 hypothetical protein DU69_07950 [Methanosarcina mazei]KKH38087.1 hypothetical protein DU54_04160 [Methanosarcina mazei]
MKIQKLKPEEILGLLSGIVLSYIMFILSMLMSDVLHFSNQIVVWVNIGLVVFFLILGHYIVSRKVIDEKKRTEDIIGLKSNLLGFFLWLIVIIIATLLNIEINPTAIRTGGYLTILLITLILLYMNKKGIN